MRWWLANLATSKLLSLILSSLPLSLKLKVKYLVMTLPVSSVSKWALLMPASRVDRLQQKIVCEIRYFTYKRGSIRRIIRIRNATCPSWYSGWVRLHRRPPFRCIPSICKQHIPFDWSSISPAALHRFWIAFTGHVGDLPSPYDPYTGFPYGGICCVEHCSHHGKAESRGNYWNCDRNSGKFSEHTQRIAFGSWSYEPGSKASWSRRILYSNCLLPSRNTL